MTVRSIKEWYRFEAAKNGGRVGVVALAEPVARTESWKNVEGCEVCGC